MLEREDLTRQIIGAFYRVYDRLGYGHLEGVYGAALEIELREMDLEVWREAPIDVWYRGRIIGKYRADFVVEQAVVLELKATYAIDESARRQLFNYLKSSHLRLGLLLHFGPNAKFCRIVHTKNIGRDEA